jgi:hypothetical protein
MQKVEGSSPFIRLRKPAGNGGFFMGAVALGSGDEPNSQPLVSLRVRHGCVRFGHLSSRAEDVFTLRCLEQCEAWSQRASIRMSSDPVPAWMYAGSFDLTISQRTRPWASRSVPRAAVVRGHRCHRGSPAHHPMKMLRRDRRRPSLSYRFPGKDRASVATPHGDDHVRRPNRFVGQRLRERIGEIDTDFRHHLRCQRVDRFCRIGTTRTHTRRAARSQRHQTSSHLASASVVDADEEDFGSFNRHGRFNIVAVSDAQDQSMSGDDVVIATG